MYKYLAQGSAGLGCSVIAVSGLHNYRLPNKAEVPPEFASNESLRNEFLKVATNADNAASMMGYYLIPAVYVWSDIEPSIVTKPNKSGYVYDPTFPEAERVYSGGQRLMEALNEVPLIGRATRSRLGRSTHGEYGIRVYSWAPSLAGREWIQAYAKKREDEKKATLAANKAFAAQVAKVAPAAGIMLGGDANAVILNQQVWF